jgi:O-antigen/teichoic acid export membrane protein
MDNSADGSQRTQILEFVKDSSKYGAARVVSIVLGLVSVPIFSRIMSPEQFGRYSLALLTVTIAYQLVNEWSRASILRFDARYRNTPQYEKYLSNVLLPPAFLGALIGGIAVALWLVLDISTSYQSYILVSVAVFALLVFYVPVSALLRVRQKAGRFSLLQVLYRAGSLLIGILLIVLFGLGGEGMLYGMFVSLVVLVPICLKWTAVIPSLSLRLLDFSEIKRYLNYGFPLMLYTLSAYLMRYTDRFMISYLRDTSEVGLYSFACLLPQRSIEILIDVIALGAFPIIVREWENSRRDAALNLTSELARFDFQMIMPILTILILFPDYLIAVIGTTRYEVSFATIPLVSVASCLKSMTWFSGIAFHLSTNTRQLLVITLCSLLVNIALNLLLIPAQGYQGAALATMITSVVYSIVIFSISRKWLPWKISGKVIGYSVMATILAAGVAVVLKGVLSGSVAGGGIAIASFAVVYLLILETTGQLRLRRFLNGIRQKQ